MSGKMVTEFRLTDTRFCLQTLARGDWMVTGSYLDSRSGY